MYRNPAKHSKHWRLSWIKYETFITFLTFRFSTRGERDTHFFTMLTVPSDPTTRGASRRPNWTRQGSDLNSLRPASNLNSLFFFQKSPKILSPSLPGMTSFISPVHFLSGVFIMTSVIVTSYLHSMCAPTRALSRTVLSLTKPKDKI